MRVVTMVIAVVNLVVASVVRVDAVVPSTVADVVVQFTVMRGVRVVVCRVGARVPFILVHVGKAMRVLDPRGAAVLHAKGCPAGVVVARVRGVVMAFRHVVVTSCRVVRRVASVVSGVVVRLVCVVMLPQDRFRFVYRAINGRADILSRFTSARNPRYKGDCA